MSRPSVVQRWLWPTSPGREVRALRSAFAVVIGLRIALGPYPFADQPESLFAPPFFLSWLPGMPDAWAMILLQVVGSLAAVLAVTGTRRRSAFIVAWITLLVLAGFRTSLGKVLHNDVLLLLAAAPFLWAPTIAAAELDRISRRYGWARRAAMVVVAAAYFFAGAQKLATSGLGWVTSDNVRNLLYTGAAGRRAPPDVVALFVADRLWLTHLVAAVTLVVECGAPLLIASRRLRPVFVAAAIGLHLGTYATLGLDYWTWIATDLIVLTGWWQWRIGRRASQSSGFMNDQRPPSLSRALYSR